MQEQAGLFSIATMFLFIKNKFSFQKYSCIYSILFDIAQQMTNNFGKSTK